LRGSSCQSTRTDTGTNTLIIITVTTAAIFGCGDEKGTGIVREDIKDAAFNKRASDRLLHMDEVDQEIFDGYVSVRAGARSR
jgi:hypothetical protein